LQTYLAGPTKGRVASSAAADQAAVPATDSDVVEDTK
jgi:hypothetical protein